MVKTANLELPLVQASQAQKHVTVNEALALLDAAAQLRLMSVTLTSPPVTAVDGAAFAVPSGADGEWATQPGKLAVFANGGWVYVVPRAGWRAWIVDAAKAAMFDGVTWVSGALAVSAYGAALCCEIVEVDVTLVAGSSVSTLPVIPASAVVLGVTGIVTETMTGTASTWRLGVSGWPDRYGSGLGLTLGSWVQGVTGQPQAYFAPTSLTLEAEGGNFAGGRVRLAVHMFRVSIPRV